MKLDEINSSKIYNFSCIYKWTNLVNGKVYIGQTQNFYMRMSKYRSGYFNRHLGFSIKKYGVDNFDITILEKDVPIDLLNIREQYWINYYSSYNQEKGYNIAHIAGSNRGLPAWNKNIPPSFEIRQKISDGLLKYYSTHEVWNKGVPATEEAKEKNRISNTKGKNGMWGRKHTEESKEKNRKSHLGKKMSYNTRRKISAPIRCVETGKEYISAVEASDEIGCSYTAIWYVLKGKHKTAKGLHWEYA